MVRSVPGLEDGSLQNFTDFFCNHVKRVRATVPLHRLVEVDIDDHNAGRLLSDIFDIDVSCWKKTNANANARHDDGSSVVPHPSQPEKLPMLIKGKAEIRGKDGVMRMNPLVMRLNLSNRIRDGPREDVLS
jgi:hypothetical protein